MKIFKYGWEDRSMLNLEHVSHAHFEDNGNSDHGVARIILISGKQIDIHEKKETVERLRQILDGTSERNDLIAQMEAQSKSIERHIKQRLG